MSDRPEVTVPLPDYIVGAAREAARTVIEEHTKVCPISKMEERLHVLERRFNLLLGAILGSGVLGGVAGAVVQKLIAG